MNDLGEMNGREGEVVSYSTMMRSVEAEIGYCIVGVSKVSKCR